MLVGWAVGGLEGMVGWGCGLNVKYTMIYYAMFPAQRRAGEDRDLSCLHHPERPVARCARLRVHG